jgi:hypothetical protein
MSGNKPKASQPAQQSCWKAGCGSGRLPHPQPSPSEVQLAQFYAKMTTLEMQMGNINIFMQDLSAQLGKAAGKLAESTEELANRLRNEIGAISHELKDTLHKAGKVAKETSGTNQIPAAMEAPAVNVGFVNRSPAIVDLPANSTTVTINLGGAIISNCIFITDQDIHLVPGNGSHIDAVHSVRFTENNGK